MADGIPAYVVKNDHMGKKKVLHQARLLLWLADYGEPMRCNLIHISDRPPGSTPDQCPPRGSDNDNSVPGCSLQYGLNLTTYLAIIDDPECVSSKLGHEVCAGAPRNVVGQPIIIHDEEENCPGCLGSYSEDVPCS